MARFPRLTWALALTLVIACQKGEKMTTTASGLQYADQVVGTGKEAKAGDLVTVHYTGTLTDGSKFDRSYDHNRPFSFPLGRGRVIKGWDEGVAGMKEGGKRKLVIPPHLGYGARGAGDKIPPDSTLVFVVELQQVRPAAEPKPIPPKTPPPETAGDWKEQQQQAIAEGLKIEETQTGRGDEAVPAKTIEVHYTGTLVDGTKFDSSVDRGQPFRFQLGAGRVIKGWDMGVAGMKEGGKRKLTIPGHLAYGPRGRPPKIPPDATLVFEIELLDVL